MGNEEIIDSVVDPIAIKQFNDLKAVAASATEQMVIATKAAIALNNATGGSQSFTVFKKNADAANDAVNTIIVNSNKAQQAQDKARAYKADMDEKAMNKYLVLLSKQEAYRQAQDDKEIAAAKVKADKLAQIQDQVAAKQSAIDARKANAKFQPIDPSNPHNLSNPSITEEPSQPVVRHEPIITGNENMSLSAKNATVSIKEETEALTEQQRVLNSVAGTFEQNVSLQLTLQSELAAVRAEMKLTTGDDAKSIATKERLTAEEIRLKSAIQANGTTLRQQAKDQLNADGSATQLNARLTQLRAAYDSLSAAEQKNVATGGVLLTEIKALDAETKKLAADQGVHNKEVGNYGNAITKSVGGAFSVLRKIAYVLPGVGLAGLIGFAVDPIIEYISKLDIVKKLLETLTTAQKDYSIAFQDTGYQKAISNIAELTENITLAKEGFLDKTKVLREYNTALGASIGYADDLDQAERNIIRNGKDYIQITLLKAAAQIALNDSAKKLAESAQVAAKPTNTFVSTKSESLQALNLLAQGRFTKQVAAAQKEDQDKQVKDLKDSADSQLKIFDDFQKRAAEIAKKNGQIDFFDGTQDAKGSKGKKPDDHANTDLLEYYRLQLEQVKKTSKIVLDDETQSYEARKAALNIYLKSSADLVKNAQDIALTDTNLRGQQRKNIVLKFNNELLDVQRDGINETEKLQNSVSAKLKKNLEDILKANEDAEKLAIEGLTQSRDEQVSLIQDAADKELAIVADKYAKGKINEKQYQKEITAIQDQANIDRLGQEAFYAQSVLAIKEAAENNAINQNGPKTPEQIATIKAHSGVSEAKTAVSKAGNALQKALNEQTQHESKPDKDISDFEKKAAEEAIQAIDLVTKARDAAYERNIEQLQKQSDMVDENAKNEISAVNSSILSSADKQRKINIIDAQAAQQKEALLARENQLKTKQAKADKEANIAKLTIQGALAVVTALTGGPILGEILAIGAAALVATELAIAIATPLPKYAKGTGNHPGGMFIWGEKGTEMAIEPSGKTYMSPDHASLGMAPAGTKIIPNHMIRPDKLNYSGGQQVPWKEVISAINKSKPEPQKRPNVKVTVNNDSYYQKFYR